MPRGDSRRGRLTRSADFDRVYRKGLSHSDRLLVVHVFPRGDDQPARLGLSVSRKVGGSVDRNLVKRLIREAFDEQARFLVPGNDIVVSARSGSAEVAGREGLSTFRQSLTGLLVEAGAKARS